MKYLFLAAALFLCVQLSAQALPKKSKTFVRVYNNEGQKIAKGRIIEVTDNALVLKKGSRSVTIPSNEIAYLKTKRTNGHNILIGGLAGAGYSLYGITQSTANDDGWQALAFIIITPITTAIGGGIGYLTTIFKNSVHYSIQQDPIKWQGFKEVMYAPN